VDDRAVERLGQLNQRDAQQHLFGRGLVDPALKCPVNKLAEEYFACFGVQSLVNTLQAGFEILQGNSREGR
jgi:hypothetical protein